jgi:hypothetical protein
LSDKRYFSLSSSSRRNESRTMQVLFWMGGSILRTKDMSY